MNKYKVINYSKKYQSDIINLWNSEVGFIFPITEDMFNQNISNSKYFNMDASFVCLDGEKVVGFILCKVYDNNNIIEKYFDTAFISLMYVARENRKQGIGSFILEKAEEVLKKMNIKKINVGSDIDNFFPGIPNDFDNLTDVFFRKRGYNLAGYTHDLVRCINERNEQNYNINDILSKIDGFTIRYAKKSDEKKVLDFFKKCFYGRWYYEAKEYFDNNDIKEEYLIVIDDKKDVVVGFLRTNKGLIDKISYNIMWKKRFNKLLGFGPLGVDIEYRKRGLAMSLLKYGTIEAYKDNFSDILIDWTGLVEFYQKLGFEVWKCYQYAYKNIEF